MLICFAYNGFLIGYKMLIKILIGYRIPSDLILAGEREMYCKYRLYVLVYFSKI